MVNSTKPPFLFYSSRRLSRVVSRVRFFLLYLGNNLTKTPYTLIGPTDWSEELGVSGESVFPSNLVVLVHVFPLLYGCTPRFKGTTTIYLFENSVSTRDPVFPFSSPYFPSPG